MCATRSMAGQRQAATGAHGHARLHNSPARTRWAGGPARSAPRRPARTSAASARSSATVRRRAASADGPPFCRQVHAPKTGTNSNSEQTTQATEECAPPLPLPTSNFQLKWMLRKLPTLARILVPSRIDAQADSQERNPRLCFEQPYSRSGCRMEAAELL